MVDRLAELLDAWSGSEGAPCEQPVSCIVVKGAGGKVCCLANASSSSSRLIRLHEQAFCAGGDVKSVTEDASAGKTQAAMRFFETEYKLDYKVASVGDVFERGNERVGDGESSA